MSTTRYRQAQRDAAITLKAWPPLLVVFLAVVLTPFAAALEPFGLSAIKFWGGTGLAGQLGLPPTVVWTALVDLMVIAPPVLVDRGLTAALSEAAARSAVPVTVSAAIPRLSDHVEHAAYFVASEALTNLNKHSGATAAELGASVSDGRLRVWVQDNGAGGADVSKGHGPAGLIERLRGVDGQLVITSPQGGPNPHRRSHPVRVLIADDSVLLRQGLALILAEGGHEVVGEAADGQALVTQALALRPGVIIADIRTPPSHTDEGLRAASRIRAQWDQAPILLLSRYVVAGYLPELLADSAGGMGYLLKDRVSDIDSFLEALERVARGELVLDPDVVTQVMSAGRRNDPLESLTPREREVLGLMAQGRTNAAIAQRLVITEGAVEKHTQRIFAKLGLLPDAAVHRRVKAVLALLQA